MINKTIILMDNDTSVNISLNFASTSEFNIIHKNTIDDDMKQILMLQYGISDIKINNQPSEIAISKFNCNFEKGIESEFLHECEFLSEFDASNYNHIDKIGKYFLLDCKNLIRVNLAGMLNITSIENKFITFCTSLTDVDLSGLKNVTSIGNYFLSGCINLTDVDLSGLKNVTSIGNNFLYGCTSSKKINLSGLKNVTTIENNFLSCCTSLIEFDTRWMKNVIEFKDKFWNNFLYDCSYKLIIIIHNQKYSETIYYKITHTNYIVKKYYDKPIVYLTDICVI